MEKALPSNLILRRVFSRRHNFFIFSIGTRHWANFFSRYRGPIRCSDKFNLYSILCQLEQFVFGFATVSAFVVVVGINVAFVIFPTYMCICVCVFSLWES